MEPNENSANVDLKKLKKVGYTLLGITGFFFVVLLIRKPFSIPFFFFLTLFSTFLIQTFKFPASLSRTEKILIKIGAVLGWFNTRLILILLFYLVLTPISFVMRIFGKHPLVMTIDKSSTSYWDDNDYLVTEERNKRQF